MFKLEADERLVMTLRKHWLVFLMQNIGFIIAALIPFIVLGIFSSGIFNYLGTQAMTDVQAMAVVMFSVCAWEMIILVVFSVALTNYYLDIIFVTSKRIIDLNQKGLFSRDVVIAPIEKMQDIKIEVNGVLATFFNYGDLYFQTAGESREFKIMGVRRAQEAKDTILNSYHVDRKEMI